MKPWAKTNHPPLTYLCWVFGHSNKKPINGIFSLGFMGKDRTVIDVILSFRHNQYLLSLCMFFLDLPASFYMSECFAWMCVWALHVCLVPMEVRRGYQIPWNWSYRYLWTTTWVMVPKSESSAGATNMCSLAPDILFYYFLNAWSCYIAQATCHSLGRSDWP